jgi:hypothetical protein
MPDLANEATKFIFEKLIEYGGSKFLGWTCCSLGYDETALWSVLRVSSYFLTLLPSC